MKAHLSTVQAYFSNAGVLAKSPGNAVLYKEND